MEPGRPGRVLHASRFKAPSGRKSWRTKSFAPTAIAPRDPFIVLGASPLPLQTFNHQLLSCNGLCRSSMANGQLAIRIAGAQNAQRGVVDGLSHCRTFQQSIRGAGLPKYASSDHDPLYRFHQWEANLRILGVTEIKTVPYTPSSHPFVERLIGTMRRECLDRLLFWTATDLEMKLIAFRNSYNGYRCHAGLNGKTPIARPEPRSAGLKSYSWQQHCRGLYQTPVAA